MNYQFFMQIIWSISGQTLKQSLINYLLKIIETLEKMKYINDLYGYYALYHSIKKNNNDNIKIFSRNTIFTLKYYKYLLRDTFILKNNGNKS